MNASSAQSGMAFLTICSANYIPQARTLFQSLAEFYPDSRYVLCLVDEVDPSIFSEDVFEVIDVRSVGVPGFHDFMTQYYSIIELNTAVKPTIMKKLYEDLEIDKVFYLDPDLFFYRPMTEIEDLFDRGQSIILTPHALGPITDTYQPNDDSLLISGSFNLGFIATRRSPEVMAMLDWWESKLEHLCVITPQGNYFVDQRWCDLVPSFFDNVHILRHPGYNVAYWNVFQRDLTHDESGWMVDDKPLVFFHFSGLPFHDLTGVSKYQNRLTIDQIGPFGDEFRRYTAQIAANGGTEGKKWPMPFPLVCGSQPINSTLARQCLRAVVKPHAGSPKGKVTDLDFLNDAVEGLPADEWFPLSKIMYYTWCEHPDLREYFNVFTRKERASFIWWFLGNAPERFNLERPFLNLDHFLGTWDRGGDHLIPLCNAMILVWVIRPDWQSAFDLTSETGRAGVYLQYLRECIVEQAFPRRMLPDLSAPCTLFEHCSESFTVGEYAVYLTRSDLHAEIDIREKKGRAAYRRWLDQQDDPLIAALRPLDAVRAPSRSRKKSKATT